MLSTLELVINSVAVVLILPLALASLFTGSKPPDHSFLCRYYHAEPKLMLIGNLFLLTVSAIALVKLATHFGLLDTQSGTTVENWIMAPFLFFMVVFLGFLAKAYLKVRRAPNGV